MDFLPSFKQSLILFFGVWVATTINEMWGGSLGVSTHYEFVFVFVIGLILGIILLTITTFVTAFYETSAQR